jgi:hypothetical protein
MRRLLRLVYVILTALQKTTVDSVARMRAAAANVKIKIPHLNQPVIYISAKKSEIPAVPLP